MALPSEIATALNALSARIQSAVAAAGTGTTADVAAVRASAVAGTFTLESGNPVIKLGAAIDPKDYLRATGTFTIDESSVQSSGWTNGTYPFQSSSNTYHPKSTTRRVFVFDEVVAVKADGVTCPLRPIKPLAELPKITTGALNLDSQWPIIVMQPGDPASYTLVSSSINLLTRYHHS